MIELKGKYNTCKVFTDIIEQTAISQIITLLNQPMSEGQTIRIMPDVHAGAGCTIGTTMTITDKVVPNLVGVDIGCGMETIKLKEKHIELERLDKLIYEKIPSGFNIRTKTHRYFDKIDLTQLYCYHSINSDRAEISLGTLGGGNHFIEADQGEDGLPQTTIVPIEGEDRVVEIARMLSGDTGELARAHARDMLSAVQEN
jgi:RNA-splicing ligase RtcB